MSYGLIWKGEKIESDIETRSEAEYLRREYQLAYNGTVRIIRE